jgi:molybdate transport system substrate-binding protein
MSRSPTRRAHAALLLVLVLALGAGGCGDAAGPGASGDAAVTVAAASDLRLAFEDLGDRFTEQTGTPVVFSFGSSGQLREQIVNGAPFDVFASADVEYADAVIDAGRGDPATRADYGFGRIALWAAEGVPLPDTVADLAGPAYRRIAVANPEHAPYGQAAIEALESAGILEVVRDRLVYGENVSDTLRIAESGNADVGIVALSLVVTGDTGYVLVPETLHQPLRQALVVTALGERREPAAAFARFVNSADGREIMVRYGFALPGEDLAAA